MEGNGDYAPKLLEVVVKNHTCEVSTVALWGKALAESLST